jgi:alpha-tubulin suppressor-like RCC1 family protein
MATVLTSVLCGAFFIFPLTNRRIVWSVGSPRFDLKAYCRCQGEYVITSYKVPDKFVPAELYIYSFFSSMV